MSTLIFMFLFIPFLYLLKIAVKNVRIRVICQDILFAALKKVPILIELAELCNRVSAIDP